MTRDRYNAFGMLLGFWAVLMLKAQLVRFLVFEESHAYATLMLEGPVILGLLLLVDGFFADHRLKALVFTDFVLTLLMAVTALYAGFYGAIPTVDAFLVVKQAATVGDSILSLLDPIYLAFFVDIIGLVVFMSVRGWIRRHSPAVSAEDLDYAFQHRFVYFAIVPAVGILVASVIGVRSLPQPIDSMAASKTRGILAFEIASLVPHDDTAKTDVNVSDPAAVQARINGATLSRPTTRTVDFAPAAFAGKNVIIIQVEALQTAVMNRRINGQEITPNLNRIARAGYYFPNAVSQTGRGTTSDAEFISNTSLYPNLSTPSSVAYADRQLTSMPRLLGTMGYTTATFHTNTVKYWNREQLYSALGFDHYFDSEYFGDQDMIMFGASDEVLFEKALDKLKAFAAGDKPFYTQVITMSAHHPYQGIPAEKLKISLEPPYESTLTGRYLQAINYTDRAIGEFMDALEESGIAEDSIFVIYGDHTGLGEDPDSDADDLARQALFGGEYSPFERTRVPMIIQLPGEEGGVVDSKPFGQVDIMPTLADLLGVDLKLTPHFGKNAFTNANTFTPSSGFMPPGTYIDDSIIFVPSATFADGKAYAIPTGSETTIEKADRNKWEAMRQLMLLSEAYVRGLPALTGYKARQDYVLPEGKM